MRPDSNWKRAYYSLEHAKNKGKLYTKHTCSDVLTLNVLFELGHKPKYITLLRAVQAENYEAVRLVLRTRTKRSTEKRIYRDHYVLSEAINRDNLSIVSLLLDEGEINPTAISHPQSLELAIAVGSYKITERLLQDPRMDPTVNDGQAILEAIKADRYDLLELLRRRDPRVVELEPEIRTLHYEEVARSTYYDCLEDHRRDDYWTYLCD
ncbi:Hypothetical protein POVR2_LOCUS269 [uncultured virus]|nr:Hypothetical protein POVR2_LOCUS269 [uncultured virus]